MKNQKILHEEDTGRIMNFMQNISRQLKTPLAVINSICERLSIRYPDIEEKMQLESVNALDLAETVANNLDLVAQNNTFAFYQNCSD